jgi:hypothetical protein
MGGARGVMMPLLRYFVYVGGVLLALLFVAGSYLPILPSAENAGPQLPVIHLYSDRKGPERIVYDTSAPMPAPAARAEAGVPAKAAGVDVSGTVRDAFAELPPSDAAKVQSADVKKPETKQPPPRKVARRHAPPRVRMVDQQFGWFGPQPGFW